MNTVIYLLIFQGILGGYDVLWNHEWKEKLPTKLTAALEQKIHGGHENQHPHEEPRLWPARLHFVDMRRGLRCADDQVVFQLARLAAFEHFGKHRGEAEADQLIRAGKLRQPIAERAQQPCKFHRSRSHLPSGRAQLKLLAV